MENQWAHIAVVLDPARRTLTAYVDGAKAGEATGVALSGPPTRLFVGRSQDDAAPTLHGRLRDLRIYRIALTAEQVATIRNNALSGRQSTRGRGTPPPEISTAAIPKRIAAGVDG